MHRRLFTILSVLSLHLCVFLGFVTVVGLLPFEGAGVHYDLQTGRQWYEFDSREGRIALSRYGDWPHAGWRDPDATCVITSVSGWELGAGVTHVNYRYFTGSGAFSVVHTQLRLPAAFLIVLIAVLPAWWLIRTWRRVRGQPAVGFDVQTRSTPSDGPSAGASA